MRYTPVRPDQWERSAEAHQAAEKQFYPAMWPGRELAFTDATGTTADTMLAIDYAVEVSLPGWAAPFKFWIQERWRDPAFYWTYRDVTITSWNRNSDTPSELHHFAAGIFVYGYYNRQRGTIAGAFAYAAAKMLYLATTGAIRLHPLPPNDRNQEVVGLDRRELYAQGCLLHHYKSSELDGTFPGRQAAAAAPPPGLARATDAEAAL